MDIWPGNTPDSLEDLCVQYCIRHLETLTCKTTSGYLSLLPGVTLPKTICDKIFSSYLEGVEHKHVLGDEFLHIFSDTQATQVSRLNLSHTLVSDKGLKFIEDQPIVDLDLSETQFSEDGIPSINKLGKTLRSLRIEDVNCLFDAFFEITVDKIENDEPDLEELQHGVMSIRKYDGIFKTPNLRKLCMRNSNLEETLLAYHETDLMDSILGSFPSLSHLDLTSCQIPVMCVESLLNLSNLVSLSLADINFKDMNKVIRNLRKLHKLKHLDLSMSNPDMSPVMYTEPEDKLRTLMSGLPNLTSLDLSGTNLSGFSKIVTASFRLGKKFADGDKPDCRPPAECSIPGLEGRSLDFLGLLGSAFEACDRDNIPAKQVSGDKDEAQVLLSLQVYQDRANLLTKALNCLFPLFRTTVVQRQCAALEAILAGMKHHPNNRHVQISGSASLFYIAKGEKKEHITQNQRRRIVDLLLRAMETFPYEQTMMRNGCLTLCHFNIPQDVIYCYEKLVKILLQMLKREHQDEFIHRIGIFLLNCLACQVDGREKEIVGSLGAIETMLDIIERKVNASECDEVMEVAWSTMWNVTDETAPNCERFMDLNGMELFLSCLTAFENRAELLRNMMGLMGNIAEVKELRCRLMVPKYVQVFSDLLDSTSDGIEVSYNAAGVLAHLASDGRDSWTLSNPSRSCVLNKMVQAINRWDIKSRRNINYRSFQPILRLLTMSDTPECQHWAAWALCNLTGFCPEKYCSLLEKENGVEKLRQVLHDRNAYRTVHRLCQRVLRQIQVRISWPEGQDVDPSGPDSDLDMEDEEGEQLEMVGAGLRIIEDRSRHVGGEGHQNQDEVFAVDEEIIDRDLDDDIRL